MDCDCSLQGACIKHCDGQCIANTHQVAQVNQQVDARNIPFFSQRRSSASAALRYCVGSTSKLRKALRHAASDSTWLKGVVPMRCKVACCSAWKAACKSFGVGPLVMSRARITPPATPG